MDLTLPYISLQPDYLQSYTNVSQSLHDFEKVWLSIYNLNAPNASIHTKLLLSSQSGQQQVDIELEETGKGLLSVKSAPQSKMDLLIASTSTNPSSLANEIASSIHIPSTIIRIPKRRLGPLVKGSLGVTAFDISPDQVGRYVVGGSDGQAYVGSLGIGGDTTHEEEEEAAAAAEEEAGLDSVERLARQRMRARLRERDEQKKTPLKGHVGDIRSVKFFPSGQVILTTSSDCTARIFGLDGANPRSLTGHRRAVTSSYMIGNGREVITSSSDGTVRLWDVGEGVQKQVFQSYKSSIVNIASMGRRIPDNRKEQEQQVSSKLIVTGLSCGDIQCHDLSSNQSVFRLPSFFFPSGEGPKATDRWEQVRSGAVEALDWIQDEHFLLAGCSNGVMRAHDMRMLSSQEFQDDTLANRSLLFSWRRNGAAVNDVRLLEGGREAIVSTSDGTPYRVDLSNSSSPHVLEEYNGWDVDNVQSSALDAKGRIWLAGAEGCIRMY